MVVKVLYLFADGAGMYVEAAGVEWSWTRVSKERKIEIILTGFKLPYGYTFYTNI